MEDRNEFNIKLHQMFIRNKKNHYIFTKAKHDHYINVLENRHLDTKKSAKDYHILRNYITTTYMGIKRLMCKKTQKFIIYMEQIYDIIYEGHIRAGHRGQKNTYRICHENIANLPMTLVKLFIDNCRVCNLKKRVACPKQIEVTSPIKSNRYGERVQIDLINMRSESHNSFNYILHYQDNATKFSILRPLKSKTAEEVNTCITEIFKLFGAPTIIQTDNGSEFSQLSELKITWPNLTLIKGRPYYPQSQGSVERANGDVVEIIKSVLNDPKNYSCDNWVDALTTVQYIKNQAFNRILGTTPHCALFGNRVTTAPPPKKENKKIERIPINSKVLVPIPTRYKPSKLSDKNLICFIRGCDDEGNYTLATEKDSLIITETFKTNQFSVLSRPEKESTISLKKAILGSKILYK